jgi:hypothetical protein
MSSQLTAKDGLMEKNEAAWREMDHFPAELDDDNLYRVDPSIAGGW